MRVLFPISAIYPSQEGGPSNTVYWIAKSLHKEGVDVVTISTNTGIKHGVLEFDKWINSDFGKVIYINERFRLLPVRLITLSLKELSTIDIVHLSSFFYPPSWIIAIIAAFKGKKIIWSPRGELYPEALKYKRIRKKIILAFIKYFFKSKVFYHATNNLETQHIQKALNCINPIFEIPNYILLPDTATADKPTKDYFLYVGRIHPIKALDNLIIALSKSEKFLNSIYTFKIVGEDNHDYADEMKKLVKNLDLTEKISFLGHIAGNQKQLMYYNAFFTFLPSHSENFGNVVIESLAQSTPVIASKGTPWEILPNKNAGYWVNNDPNILKDVIDEITILSTEEYKKMCDNSCKLVFEQYDIEKNIEIWINVYTKILNSCVE